jgi:hypothetical protein
MGGVDVHDQIRLQLAVTFRKYYKAIFLGLIDMALVNAFIVFREAQDQRVEKHTDHSMFLKLLESWIILLMTSPPTHVLFLGELTMQLLRIVLICRRLAKACQLLCDARLLRSCATISCRSASRCKRSET